MAFTAPSRAAIKSPWRLTIAVAARCRWPLLGEHRAGRSDSLERVRLPGTHSGAGLGMRTAGGTTVTGHTRKTGGQASDQASKRAPDRRRPPRPDTSPERHRTSGSFENRVTNQAHRTTLATTPDEAPTHSQHGNVTRRARQVAWRSCARVVSEAAYAPNHGAGGQEPGLRACDRVAESCLAVPGWV